MRRSEVIKIAEFLHETVKIWSEVNKDFSMKSWSDSEEWEREFMIDNVINLQGNHDYKIKYMHEVYVHLKVKFNKENGKNSYVPNKLWVMLPRWQKKKYKIIRQLAIVLMVKEGPAKIK